MTMLEQSISKTALAHLDHIRQARGIRSRKQALEQILAEAQNTIRVAKLRESIKNAPMIVPDAKEASLIAEVEKRGRRK